MTVTDGWTRVVALSVASVISATRVAVTAGELTPCQVFAPEMVTRRATARIGLTTLFEVGITLGSNANGMAKPPAEPPRPRARYSSWLIPMPATLFQKAER